MLSKRICRSGAMLAASAIFSPTATSAQGAGSNAYAEAGAICCTVQAGSNVQGNSHLTPFVESTAAASFASPGVGISHPVLANASAYANLATGKIGAAAISTNYGFTRAIGAFEETLTFDIAGASASTITPITFNFLYHGTIQPSYGLASTAFGFSAIQNLGYGGVGSILVDRTKGSGNDQDQFFSRVQKSGWLDFSSLTDAVGDTYTMRATFGLIGSAPVLRLSEYINLYTWQGADADFLHTASLTLDVPDNAAYRSASGVFLSQVAVVPECSTWAMMIVGFAFVGGSLRYRHRSTRVVCG